MIQLIPPSSTIPCIYHPTPRATKPSQDETKIIVSELGKKYSDPRHLTRPEILKMITDGHAHSWSIYKQGDRKAHSLISAMHSTVELDFDNKTKEKILPPSQHIYTPDRVISELAAYGLKPWLIYPSSSNSPEHPKFHVVLDFDIQIPDKDSYLILTNLINHIFPSVVINDREYNPLDIGALKHLGVMYSIKINPLSVILYEPDSPRNSFKAFMHKFVVKYASTTATIDLVRAKLIPLFESDFNIQLKDTNNQDFYFPLTEIDSTSWEWNTSNIPNTNNQNIYSDSTAATVDLDPTSDININVDPVYDIETDHKKRTIHGNKPSNVINHFKNIPCPLIEDFIAGRRLEHQEWINVLSQFAHYGKGTTAFMDIAVTVKGYNIPKMNNAVKDFKKSNIHPYTCGNCEFKSGCKGKELIRGSAPAYHSVDKKSSTPIKFALKDIEYEDLPLVQNKLKNDIDTLLDYSGEEPILGLLRYQCGIGKTELLLRAMSNTQKRIIFSCPTIAHKREIAERASAMGIIVNESPDYLDMSKYYSPDDLIMLRAGDNPNNAVINRILTDIKSDPAIRKICREHSSALLNVGEKKFGLVVTTHALLPFIIKDGDETAIIDEDPRISFSSPISVSHKDILRINEYLDRPINIEGGGLTSYAPLTKSEYSGLKKSLIQSGDIKLFTTPILSAIRYGFSSGWLTATNWNIIPYPPAQLNKLKTIIVASATADPDVLKSIIPNRKLITYSANVKYASKLSILTKFGSLGRTKCKNIDPNIWTCAEVMDADLIVGSKALINQIPEYYKSDKLSFEQCPGRDEWAGKRVVVIGTPNPSPDELYQVAKLINPEFNIQDEKELVNYKFAHVDGSTATSVNHCPQDMVLRKAWQYIVNTLLVQSDRSRALTNSSGSCIYISTFPVDGINNIMGEDHE